MEIRIIKRENVLFPPGSDLGALLNAIRLAMNAATLKV